MNNNNLARRASSSPLAPLPKTGYVTIAGRRHLVRIEPYQQAIQQQPDPKPTKRQPTYYEVPDRRDQPPPFSKLAQLTPTNFFLALITMTLFLVGASMFSISLTAYSNSVERIDRIRRLIHVE